MKIWIWIVITAGSLVGQQQRVSVTHEKPRVAILPFDVARVSERQVFDKSGVTAFSEAAAQKALNAFVEMKRFTVIERAAIDKILNEQNFQMGDFADDQTITSIGKLLGTEYIVHGQIQSVSTSKKEKKYRAQVQLHLRIIDVASGEVKSSRDVSGKSEGRKELGAKIAYEALEDAEIGIAQFIRSAFPVEGRIVRLVVEGKKKEKKEFVLISCGKEIGTRVGDRFHVVQEEEIEVDGQTFKRQKAIGKLKVKRLEVDGIFSICEIVDGKKAIKAEMDVGKELTVISIE